VDDRWAAKLENFGKELFHKVLGGSVVLCREYPEMRASVCGQTRADDTRVTAAELREESAKVLAPAREVGCVESEFWLEVVCSSHGAVLKLFWCGTV